MKAVLLLRDKYVYADGDIREMTLWRLPEPDPERLHGLEYSLFYGRDGERVIGYDNERGKGDHRHYRDREESYSFESVEQLIHDFQIDVENERGKK